MVDKLVVDVTAGTQTMVPLTAEEEAIRARDALAFAAAEAVAERCEAFVEGLRPSPAILKAVRKGDHLTGPQVQAVVRWLVAREYVAEMAG